MHMYVVNMHMYVDNMHMYVVNMHMYVVNMHMYVVNMHMYVVNMHMYAKMYDSVHLFCNYRKTVKFQTFDLEKEGREHLRSSTAQ